MTRRTIPDAEKAQEWRPVPGFPGYDVSDTGRVRSWRPWRSLPLPRLMTPTANDRGYQRMTLRRDGQPVPGVKVHQLVMAAFVGPRLPEQHTRHLDGDPTNNHLTNLAYGTSRDNQLDLVRSGGHCFASRQACSQGHPYDSTTRRDRKGARVCGECQRKFGRESARRRRAQQRQEKVA